MTENDKAIIGIKFALDLLQNGDVLACKHLLERHLRGLRPDDPHAVHDAFVLLLGEKHGKTE
jgi:hypothetical protein